jgi:drug/metabolite transporter (DMT)-like permease
MPRPAAPEPRPGRFLEKTWLLCAVVATGAWGVWGAAIDTAARAGFPETLGYIVWALTMIPPCVVAIALAGWKLDTDRRSIALGGTAGALGAGGQLVLFKVLRLAPAHLVFPFLALSPLVTILLALLVRRERTSRGAWAGIALALAAAVLLACSPPEGDSGSGSLWVPLALVVFLAWGLQGFVISQGNRSMRAESIFFYMTVAGLLLVPVAWAMTDLREPLHWGFPGPWLAAMIHGLNAVGSLLLVYAFRYGKAIVVSPLVNAGAPLITILLSLALCRTAPSLLQGVGMVAAIVATVRLAVT